MVVGGSLLTAYGAGVDGSLSVEVATGSSCGFDVEAKA